MAEQRYELRSSNPHETFPATDAWQESIAGWQVAFDGGTVVVSGADAERLLRAWQLAAFLCDQHEIEFAPGPVGPLFPGREQVYRRVNTAYPRPDAEFRAAQLVEDLFALLARFVTGTADAVTTAAALLKQLEAAAGGAGADVAGAFNLEPALLARLHALLERRTDEVAEPHTLYRGPEWQWLQEVMRLLVLQAGRRGDGEPPRTQLTMTSLVSRL